MAQKGQREERKQAFEPAARRRAVAQFGKLLYRRLAVGPRIAAPALVNLQQPAFTLPALQSPPALHRAVREGAAAEGRVLSCFVRLPASGLPSDWGKIENRPKKPA